MKIKSNRAIWWCLPAVMLAVGASSLLARSFDGAGTEPTTATTTPSGPLRWESDHKTLETKESQLTADFFFAFTNASDAEVVIDHVKASCSCTTAKLPSEPWHLPAHTNGQISASVDLKGKMGTFDKTVMVFFAGKDTNVPPVTLRLTVKMPDRNGMRTRNMQLAAADRQAVFKGDCAKCHVPAPTLTGMALFRESCGICHEARPRASMTPDLRLLPHPTDLAFWKTSIANGKPGTLMPAFAKSQGGPLTDQQIEELAQAIEEAYPYSRFGGHPPQAAPPSHGPSLDSHPIVSPIPAQKD